MNKRAVARKKTKALPKDLEINRRREWRFDMPLPAVVEGKLADGGKFKEETLLRDISSGGAYFVLKTGVAVGSKLRLTIELPKKLSEGKPMRLKIGGVAIRLEKPGTKVKRQGVAVRFAKNYKVIAAPAKK